MCHRIFTTIVTLFLYPLILGSYSVQMCSYRLFILEDTFNHMVLGPQFIAQARRAGTCLVAPGDRRSEPWQICACAALHAPSAQAWCAQTADNLSLSNNASEQQYGTYKSARSPYSCSGYLNCCQDSKLHKTKANNVQ